MIIGNKTIIKRVCAVMFSVYVVLLTWIILFKANPGTFDVMFDPDYRNISFELYFNSRETLLNVVAFVPLGMYLRLLVRNDSIKKQTAMQVLAVIGVSLCYEVMQYVLAVGTSDITDLLTNTLGGVAGIAGYWVVCHVLKDKADMTYLALASFATAGMYVAMRLFY